MKNWETWNGILALAAAVGLCLALSMLAERSASAAGPDIMSMLHRDLLRIIDTTSTPRLCGGPVPSSTQIVSSGGDGGVSVPATAASSRRFITICNSGENSGSPKVKCREDGTNVFMGLGSPGDVLTVGQCVPYAISDQVTVKCDTDTAGTWVNSTECR